MKCLELFGRVRRSIKKRSNPIKNWGKRVDCWPNIYVKSSLFFSSIIIYHISHRLPASVNCPIMAIKWPLCSIKRSIKPGCKIKILRKAKGVIRKENNVGGRSSRPTFRRQLIWLSLKFKQPYWIAFAVIFFFPLQDFLPTAFIQEIMNCDHGINIFFWSLFSLSF